jgi:hypothetical protein
MEQRQQKDKEKKLLCAKQGITLIVIPYWWDRTSASVAATIHAKRSDLIPVPGKGTPINDEAFHPRMVHKQWTTQTKSEGMLRNFLVQNTISSLSKSSFLFF